MTAHLFLALAREKAQPVAGALGDVPRSTGEQGYVHFLRSHDELSFRQLDPGEAEDAFRAYAPDRRMRIFRRGVRRRLAPLLGGDRRRDEASLLSWVRHALLVRREIPLPGRAEPEILSGRDPSVLALLYRHPEGSLLTVHNFSSRPSRSDLTLPDDLRQDPSEVLSDRAYRTFRPAEAQVDVGAWGYRWFRL